MHRVARKLVSAALMSTSVLAMSGPVGATELLVNGGFETGNFSGWTVGPNLGSGCDSDWVVVPVVAAVGCATQLSNPIGNYAAYVGLLGFDATLPISQAFAVGTGIQQATLSWQQTANWLMVFPRTFRVDLYDQGNVLVSNVYTEILNPSIAGQYPWTPHSFDLTSLLRQYESSSLRLVFSVTVQGQGVPILGIDQVSLDVIYGLCSVTSGNDICLVSSSSQFPYPATDAGNGFDVLQLGGAAAFSFDVSQIGGTFANFEAFQKVDASNVTLTGNAGAGVNWDIQGGTLTASGGNAVGDTSSVNVAAGATFALANGETIGSLSGLGSVSLGPNTLTTGGDNSSTAFGGVLSGTGGLVKDGTGTFSLSGAQAYSGLTSINAGSLGLDGSLPGSVNIAPGAFLRGNATVGGGVNNAGVVAPGNGIGAMTFGAYSAASGAGLLMDVQFGVPASVNGVTHDHLTVTGDVSGVTTISIVPSGTNGPRNEYELVRVGGAATKNSFQLAAPIINGGHQFKLRYVKNAFGSDDAYFLKGEPRDPLVLSASLLSAGQALVGNCFRKAEGFAAARSELGFSASSVVADSGSVTSSNQLDSCATGEAALVSTSDVRIGVSALRANAAGTVELADGASDYSGDVFAVRADGAFAVDAYTFNISAGFVTGEWVVGSAPLATKGAFASVSLDRTIDLGVAALKLAAESSFDALACGGPCLLEGTHSDTTSLTVKANARIEAPLFGGAVKPYLAASAGDELLGARGVMFEDAFVRLAPTAEGVAFGAGADVVAGDAMRGFVEVRRNGDGADARVVARSGLKFTW